MNEICLSCKKHTKCGRAKHETIGCGYYVPMTNEEWFCAISTEEKAHELYRRCNYASIFGSPTAEEFEKWLKEVHEK